MKLKNIGKNLLALGLATTMALSGPMAVFAKDANDATWAGLVTEVSGLLSAKTKGEVAEEINKLKGNNSKFEALHDFVKDEDPDLYDVLTAKSGLDLDKIKTLVDVITNGKDVEAGNLEEAKLIPSLNAKRDVVIEEIGEDNLNKVKDALAKLNEIRGIFEGTTLRFLAYSEGKFTIGEETKLETLIDMAGDKISEDMKPFVKVSKITDYLALFSEKATPSMKEDMLQAAQKYNLMVEDKEEVPPSTPDTDTPSTPSTGGGGGGSNPSKDAQKDIAAAEKKLSEKDADVSAIVESILKDIAKLDTAGAKAVSKTIIPTLADVINKAEGVTNKKAAQDAIVKVVQALVNRVTTQEVEVKDGKATLSASKVKEQIKDAQDMIAQLNKELEKKEIQVTKTVKVTLSFEIDKELAEVEVVIPEGLWKAIDKKANLAVRAKGVELTLEHNTFAEEAYAINVKEEDGLVELTTTGTFTQPIVVTFSVDKKVTNYPTVFQVIGEDDKLVGGTYNAETGTIKVSLKHFSFYTVKENAPKAFTDISGLTWEKKAVNELSARGYLAGMTENTFVPHANTTRAEFAAMLTRVLPVAEVEGELNFTDLKEDAWYYKSIETAVNQGWLVGRENNKFDPAAQITRQEVASVLSRILEQKGYLQTADVEEGVNVVAWAKDAVSLYLREVETKEITELDMSQAATRAELAAMIYQVMAK